MNLLIAQEVMDQVGTPGRDAELVERDTHRRRLGIERVKVDDHEQAVQPVARRLPVEKDAVVVGFIKGDVVGRLQSAVLAADAVHAP